MTDPSDGCRHPRSKAAKQDRDRMDRRRDRLVPRRPRHSDPVLDAAFSAYAGLANAGRAGTALSRTAGASA